MGELVVESAAGKKKTVNQKNVAIMLASLVGTMTASAILLLGMENGPITGAVPSMAGKSEQSIASLVEPKVSLQAQAWNYIIIYQSGDAGGSSASLTAGHQVGGDGTSNT